MSVKFVLNETSYFGANARQSLAEEIKKRNLRKVFLVSDCRSGSYSKSRKNIK